MNEQIDYKTLLAASSEEDLVLFQSDLVTKNSISSETDPIKKTETKRGLFNFSWSGSFKLPAGLPFRFGIGKARQLSVEVNADTTVQQQQAVGIANGGQVHNSTTTNAGVEDETDSHFGTGSIENPVQRSHECFGNSQIYAGNLDGMSSGGLRLELEDDDSMSDAGRYYDDHRSGESEEDPLFGGRRKPDVYKQVKKPRSSRLILGLTVVIVLAAIIAAAVAVGIIFGRSKGSPEKDNDKPHTEYQYKSAAVATDAAPCSTVGKNMLKTGGGAVDAAIASLLCLGLYNSHSMGIGGGHFMMYYHKAKNTVEFIDAREEAPLAATKDMFVNKSSTFGGLAIAVPGEVDGYWVAHQRYGLLPWRELFLPSIQLAEEGVTVGPHLESALDYRAEFILNDTSLSEIFTDGNGNLLRAGDTMYRPLLAKTLRQIAEGDVNSFYRGEMAETIAAEIQERGGIVTVEDLAKYRVKRKTPLSFQFKNLTFYNTPPPGSGAVFSLILNILEGYNFTSESIVGTDASTLTHHRIVEAFKFAYGLRSSLGDEDYVDVEQLVANMTSEEYAASLRAKINDSRTYDYTYYHNQFEYFEDGGTSHTSIVDQYGNAVAVTSTINLYFGSKVRGNRTGIIYNNEMDDFSTPGRENIYDIPPSEANFIEPGKRPQSSMTPTIAIDENGDVRFVVGGAGGTLITTAVSLVTMETFLFGADLKTGNDRPRLHHQLIPEYVYYEDGFPQDVLDGLKRKGHNVTKGIDHASVQVIHRLEDNWLDAYCDRRKDGMPDGF